MKRPRAQVVFALGFFALAAQTLLFRDFLAAFEGNELGVGSFFSSWLLWVAAGAVAGRLSRVTRRFEVLTLLYLPAFVLQHYAILYVRILAGVKSYELFPLGTMIASSFVANAPVSFLTGFLFTLGCRWWAGDTESERGVRETLPVARVYILEALGACAGGVAVTLLLAQGTPPETIATLAALVLASAVAAARVSSPARLAATAVLVAALASGATRSWAALNNRAEWTRLLPSDEYRGSFSTAQGKYLYGYEGEEFAVMAWGGVCETPFIRIHAAEVIAANLCQRPNARNVLVVGPGSLPICLGLLELPQIEGVAWLHPDPEYPARLLEVLSASGWETPAHLEVPREDVRTFLRSTDQRYDLAILNLPDATSLVLNRYYTAEFVSLLKTVLSDGGAVSFRISGGENYLGGELACLGASALMTLEAAFQHVALKPGDESWLMASDGADLSESPAELRDRFGQIDGAAGLYPPDALMSQYLPDRIAFQRSVYRDTIRDTAHGILANTDRRPKALLYSLLIALRRGGVSAMGRHLPAALRGGAWICGAAIALYGVLRAVFLLRSSRAKSSPRVFDGYFLVFSMGLAGMSLSVVLMFLYQSQFGALFLHVGLIAALFMFGSFAGSLGMERLLLRRNAEANYVVPSCVAIHVILVALVFALPAEISRIVYAPLFVLAGVLTGVYFPVAAHRMKIAGRRAEQAGARLEMLDHAGGAAGAALTGIVMLPMFGVPATLVVLAVLIAVNAVPALVSARGAREGDAFDRAVRPAGYAMFGVGAFVLASSQVFAAFEGGEESRKLLDAARAMTGVAEVREEHAQLDDGSGLTYFAAVLPDETEVFVFSSAPLAEGAIGYGGPITLAVCVDRAGVLRGFRIIDSKETPAYLELLEPWMKSLVKGAVAGSGAFERVDAVSGATLSSRAILEALETSTGRFAAAVLGLAGKEASPRIASRPLAADRDFLLLAGFVVVAVAARYWPNRWFRRAYLAACVVVPGVMLNLQYSSQHVFALLGLSIPAAQLTGPFFIVVVVPVVVVLFGNVYCGYVCPFGALQELVGECRPRVLATDPDKGVWRYGRFVKYILLLLLAVLFGLTRDYAVIAADPLTTIFGAARQPVVVGMAAGILVLSFFYRRFWCRNLCPAGAFLSLVGGVQLFKKLVPAPRPRRCDLGVRNANELDCLHCDRCRYETD